MGVQAEECLLPERVCERDLFRCRRRTLENHLAPWPLVLDTWARLGDVDSTVSMLDAGSLLTLTTPDKSMGAEHERS
jgi:hypothetical protein